MNAENEKPALPGGSLSTDDTETVQQASVKINGKAAPPVGCGFVNGQLVPVEMHPALLPEPERITQERIALRAMMEWVRLCEGHVGKVTAFYFLIGEDERRPGVIADALGINRKTFENYRNECAAWLEGFVAGLESESIPMKGKKI